MKKFLILATTIIVLSLFLSGCACQQHHIDKGELAAKTLVVEQVVEQEPGFLKKTFVVLGKGVDMFNKWSNPIILGIILL